MIEHGQNASQRMKEYSGHSASVITARRLRLCGPSWTFSYSSSEVLYSELSSSTIC